MIDSRADIHPSAKIAAEVRIGPWTIIDSDVEIGNGTWIGPHVVIRGPSIIGRENRIFQFCSIGDDPQDMKYSGEKTELWIGDRNTIREFCTINRGTEQDKGQTRIGNDNWIMAYVHIAHDCIVGDHCVFSNNATLAGHVCVGDYATLGGFAAVHQFCTIGSHSFLGNAALVSKDVPPYVMVAGKTSGIRGLNLEGLKRRGFSDATLLALKKAYRILYRNHFTLEQALSQLLTLGEEDSAVRLFVDFLQKTTRGIIR